MTRTLTIRLHDATVGIWQDDANDPTFRSEIYAGVIREMRSRGWVVQAEPRVRKHYPSISRDNRIASRGDMRALVKLSGRVVYVEFWAETWPVNNPNGRRYDFDKRKKMVFLDRLRLDLETSKILSWLENRAVVTVSVGDPMVRAGRGGLTASEWIARDYAKSWHADKALGRPVCTQACNSRSADGGVIEHGATVWFADRKGRVRRGVAHYNLNNKWWVVTDRFGLENRTSFEIFTEAPADLRAKQNERLRRGRLEAELRSAIQISDFARAALLKRIAFGEEPTYGIWSNRWGSFYAANAAGYTKDSLAAGRYTWDEAVAEVRRVPHYLSLVMPDGSHVAADALATAGIAA